MQVQGELQVVRVFFSPRTNTLLAFCWVFFVKHRKKKTSTTPRLPSVSVHFDQTRYMYSFPPLYVWVRANSSAKLDRKDERQE